MSYSFTFNDAMEVGQQKMNIEIPGWNAFEVEAITNGFLITGTANEHGADSKIVISEADLNEAAITYEHTGKCWDCKGIGEVFHGWNHKTGTKNKTCPKCNGNGRAK